MILKTCTHDRGTSDCWNFYDNIESASVYHDAAVPGNLVAVRFKGADSDVVILITGEAYLCNDNGRTIERLLPHIPQPRREGDDVFPR